MLTQEVKNSINESVLCWLATSDSDGFPNCSPKEVFTYHSDNRVLIANIASPESVKNINANRHVCISFIHVFKQKGFKLKGIALYHTKIDKEFKSLFKAIQPLSGDFPVSGIISIEIQSARPIIAPNYLLKPGTNEAQQIASAKTTYGV